MTQDVETGLRVWADKWGVPRAAIPDLVQMVGGIAPAPPPPPKADSSEGWAQSAIRLEGAAYDAYLYRNNVGALKDARGVPVRYGLANDTPEMNTKWKSGDLIGIRAVVIRPDMIGRTFGQFISREIKAPGWKFTGTPRETAQLNWANLINRLGGDACFASGLGSFEPSP